MHFAFSPDEVIRIVQPREVRGAAAETIRGIASLAAARAGDLSFLGNAKYRAEVATSAAAIVLLPAGHAGEPPPGQCWLLVDNPSLALARVCARIEHSLWPKPAPGVHPSAVVHSEAVVDPSATVGPLCVVEAGAQIGARSHLQGQVWVGRAASVGEDCWLMPGVRIAAECVLKNRVRLQAGAIIGSDGFGYEFVAGRHEKMPQIGNVVLEDDVEIGAGTTIDRARFSSTVVGEGSKIDNLVQIAHNVVIGKHCIVCAQTGISGQHDPGGLCHPGGTGRDGRAHHAGQGARVGRQVRGEREPGAGILVRGTPARPYMFEQRLTALRQRLPELFKRVATLEKAAGAKPPAPEAP